MCYHKQRSQVTTSIGTSFPREIFQNSAGRFAKFHSLPQKIVQSVTWYCCVHFIDRLRKDFNNTANDIFCWSEHWSWTHGVMLLIVYLLTTQFIPHVNRPWCKQNFTHVKSIDCTRYTLHKLQIVPYISTVNKLCNNQSIFVQFDDSSIGIIHKSIKW